MGEGRARENPDLERRPVRGVPTVRRSLLATSPNAEDTRTRGTGVSFDLAVFANAGVSSVGLAVLRRGVVEHHLHIDFEQIIRA